MLKTAFMTEKQIVIGNWKMNGLLESSEVLVGAVVAHKAACEVAVCPPFSLLFPVRQWLAGSTVHLGAQNCHSQESGAFTGDISAAQLKDMGCAYVIVGHSERRQLHGERDELVSAKAAAAIAHGLVPVICVGETLEEREASKALAVVEAQLRGSIPESAKTAQFLLAYEPVWAIGSGLAASEGDIASMHAHIITTVQAMHGSAPRVLYGGSVKADNAPAILGIKGVGGVLVGGASLKAKEFCGIIDAAKG